MAQRKVNWFAIGISIAVVVVLIGIGAAVWWGNALANSAGEAPDSPAVDASTGAIAVGDGPDTVDTYVDFMCPACASFEQAYGPALADLAADGTITLNIHPVSILDRASGGTEYSTRAANAAYCVAEDDPDNVLPFVQAMYANQPSEGGTGLTDDEIIAIAQGAGASDAVAECITDGTYKRFVTAMTRETPVQEGASGVATPTIVVNGEVLSNQTDLTGDPERDIVSRFN
ncbi:thioredoxin domain-containing protein [Microbacterium lushaniae]|nr:thioredoxin domain-containing protein [Microbacterium lushaniae]KAA9153561.1 thioredoxin domain-containing protein [Microbacterium lushaniae]